MNSLENMFLRKLKLLKTSSGKHKFQDLSLKRVSVCVKLEPSGASSYVYRWRMRFGSLRRATPVEQRREAPGFCRRRRTGWRRSDSRAPPLVSRHREASPFQILLQNKQKNLKFSLILCCFYLQNHIKPCSKASWTRPSEILTRPRWRERLEETTSEGAVWSEGEEDDTSAAGIYRREEEQTSGPVPGQWRKAPNCRDRSLSHTALWVSSSREVPRLSPAAWSCSSRQARRTHGFRTMFSSWARTTL